MKTATTYLKHYRALRLLATIIAERHPADVGSVEDVHGQALTLAEDLGMRRLIAHCHLSLGTLHTKIGRRERAGIELTAAMELYRAMDMMYWLPRAEAMRAKVGGAGETTRGIS
jgi:hypothetical protein